MVLSIKVIYFLFGFMMPPLIYLFPVILAGLLYDCRGKSYIAILMCYFYITSCLFSTCIVANTTATVIIAGISFILILCAICKGWFAVSKRNILLLLFVNLWY